MTPQDISFLEGLASFDVVLIKLVKDTKRPTRSWEHFERLHKEGGGTRLDLVQEWLGKGYGIGYLLRGGLAVIDVDDPSTMGRLQTFEQQHGIVFPKVMTPSGGTHLLFQHPPELDRTRMKNHVCHPKVSGLVLPWDFKLGERTMLVAPGTVKTTGAYQAGIWLPPPYVDVLEIEPSLQIFRESKPFLRDERPLKHRTMRAMCYLRKAKPSIDGSGGRKRLHEVATHLVAYCQLDPYLALHLMTVDKKGFRKDGTPIIYKSWNSRCIGANGEPKPWRIDELLYELENAVDATPAWGVKEYELYQQRRLAIHNMDAFLNALSLLPPAREGGFISKGEVYKCFLSTMDVDRHEMSDREFGLIMNRAILTGRLRGVQSGQKFGVGRVYLGITPERLAIAMLRYDATRTDFHSVA